jgi:Flp pilus assembly protein TadD
MTPDPRLAVAEAYLGAGRPQQALDTVGPALAAQPENRSAAVLVARALMALDRHDEARSVTERLLGAHPNDEQAWRLHALACAHTDDWFGARQSARRAVALAPQEWRTHHVAALVDVMVERIDGDTWAQVNEAVRLAPEEPSTHFVAGNVALRSGALDVGERAFHEVLRLDPDHADARNNLGVIQQRRGKVLPGAISYADALRMDPDNRLALRNLDRAVVRSGWRLQWCLGLAMTGLARAGLDSAGGIAGIAGIRVICAVMATAIAAVAGAYLWRLRSRTSRNLRRYLRSLPRRRPFFVASVLATGLIVPALLVAAADPGVANIGFLVTGLVTAVGLLLTLVELRRKRA